MAAAKSGVSRGVFAGLLAIILGVSFSAPAAAAEVCTLRVSQVVTAPPRVIAFLEILDQRQNLAPVTGGQLSAALGSSAAAVEGLQRFGDLDEGVAYIFLVDVSKSLKEKEFAQMRQVLCDWIGLLTPKDRAGIVTFGQDVREALDFTDNKDALQNTVNQLGPTDMQTQLHQGIIKALEMGRRTDANLPRRRAIITLSDGQDDFAGGATRQEVLARLQVDPVPIYAIGFYAPPRKPAKEEALKTLGEFARTSGGSYFRADTSDFAQVYGRMRQRINDVYVATLDCQKAPWDGAVRHLQVDLCAGPQGLRAGMDLRLSSWEPPPPPETEDKGASQSPTTEQTQWPGFLPPWPIAGRVIPGWAYGGAVLGLLLLCLALVLFLRQRRPPRGDADAPAPETPWRQNDAPGEPIMADKIDFPQSPQPLDPTIPVGGQAVGGPGLNSPGARLIKVRLSFVRSEPGQAPWVFTLTRALVIGRTRPPSDLAIPGDKEVSRKHCQLLAADGFVQILDLGSTNGTLVNGVPISGQYRLKHDDIILVGKTELRLALL